MTSYKKTKRHIMAYVFGFSTQFLSCVIFFSKINIVKMWVYSTLIYPLCFKLGYVFANLIECRDFVNEVIISNFNGVGDLNQNLYFCRNCNVKICTYEDCHVNYIMLPVQEISDIFTEVTIINLRCTGNSYVNYLNDDIKVIGCQSGK